MNKEIKKTSIGGQALIEGILMRGPTKVAVALRQGDAIVLKEKPLPKVRTGWHTWPLIRGVLALVDAMHIGMDALMESAEAMEESDPQEPSWIRTKAPAPVRAFWEKHGDGIEKAGTIGFSLVVAIGLFFFLPTLLTSVLGRLSLPPLLLNLVEGGIRIAIFLAYVILISRMDEIRRVFGYHGAEHKTIHCYEHGEELTVVNVRKYPIAHPRCGTSFLFNVMLISIVVLSFFGWPNPWLRLLVRLAMLPVIAGLAYEVNRIAGRSDAAWAKWVSKPGEWLQNVATVREPEDDQIEVAIAALQEVIPEDGTSDVW